MTTLYLPPKQNRTVQHTLDIFNDAATSYLFSPPAGTTSANIEMWAGGGSGGGQRQLGGGAFSPGSGGGGGAYLSFTVTLDPTESYDLSVGIGGAAAVGLATSQSPGNGGTPAITGKVGGSSVLFNETTSTLIVGVGGGAGGKAGNSDNVLDGAPGTVLTGGLGGTVGSTTNVSVITSADGGQGGDNYIDGGQFTFSPGSAGHSGGVETTAPNNSVNPSIGGMGTGADGGNGGTQPGSVNPPSGNTISNRNRPGAGGGGAGLTGEGGVGGGVALSGDTASLFGQTSAGGAAGGGGFFNGDNGQFGPLNTPVSSGAGGHGQIRISYDISGGTSDTPPTRV